ncbi:MAG TPA: alanine--tRNA ligase [Acidimicrobiales bacterium]|nr:alanine--tRNA ligase [Acidimicrobiales bacterium]
MHANDLRRAFTDFFVARGHTLVPSAGLIPHHPRAPLFTNAGMNQFIPYILGEEPAPYLRATSIQKCVRIRGKHDDIEQVGRTTRHLTFFEMLGNWSFGDYFKEGAIVLAWELFTGPLGFDGDRIWVSVHEKDDEAEQIWRDTIGIPAGRIQRLGDEDNFWEMGDTGPCGPDSELYYDRGPEYGRAGGPGGGGGPERYVELWNLVFMQYDRQADGTLEPLPKKNVDTGAGLERVLMLLQDVPSVWETDVLRPLIATAERLTGRRYGEDAEVDVALRILADHTRSTTFLINDGVFPSNEDRGYVLRRLIRRAVRQAFSLGVDKPVAAELVSSCVSVMADAYPELARSVGYIADVAAREEARFRATLRAGLSMLEAELAQGGTGAAPEVGRGPGSRTDGAKVVSGEAAFRLHDTHGFPIELTREIAAERGATVDEAGFEAAMRRQREQSQRAGRRAPTGDDAEVYRRILDDSGPTRFVGYTDLSATTTVTAVVERGDRIEIFLASTPFYAEGGGQVGDTGRVETATGVAVVEDTTYALPGLVRHLARLESGSIEEGQTARAAVDAARRAAIRRNHTGTHLVHWALRQVLGEHVKQQGSLVAPERLRFDFTHYGAMTPEQVAAVEDLVNAAVLADEDVVVTVMPKAEADAAGAIAFFEEKYGEEVRVVRAGSESVELCGGTHVERLGQIGPFEIVSEGSIGSNLRRIEATTGTATLDRLRRTEKLVAETASLLRATPDELTTAVERKLAEVRELEARLKKAEQAALAGRARAIAAEAADGSVVARVDGLGPDQLRELAAQVRQIGGFRAVVLGGSPDGEKASLVAVVEKGASPSAPELISPAARTVGGGGGGRNPEQAMAGGRDPSRLDEALEQVRRALQV